MTNRRYVKLEKDGIEGECLPSAVEAWKRNGWTVVDDGTSEADEQAVDSGTSVEYQATPVADTDEE